MTKENTSRLSEIINKLRPQPGQVSQLLHEEITRRQLFKSVVPLAVTTRALFEHLTDDPDFVTEPLRDGEAYQVQAGDNWAQVLDFFGIGYSRTNQERTGVRLVKDANYIVLVTPINLDNRPGIRGPALLPLRQALASDSQVEQLHPHYRIQIWRLNFGKSRPD